WIQPAAGAATAPHRPVSELNSSTAVIRSYRRYQPLLNGVPLAGIELIETRSNASNTESAGACGFVGSLRTTSPNPGFTRQSSVVVRCDCDCAGTVPRFHRLSIPTEPRPSSGVTVA